jgi:N-carbamoylputrescine amidase
MSKIKVGLVQMSCTADKQANLRKAMDGIREAAAGGAQIVCLQELFTSLYFCDVEDYENFKLAEAIPGPSTDALGALAAELKVVVIASLFEKRAQGIYHRRRDPGRLRCQLGEHDLEWMRPGDRCLQRTAERQLT